MTLYQSIVFSILLCACAGKQASPKTNAEINACALVKAVIEASIKPTAVEPLMRLSCAKQYAFVDQAIWVDARVFPTKGPAIVPSECKLAGHKIQFGAKTDAHTPKETVVFISIADADQANSPFTLQIENADCQSRAPNTYGISPCGVVNGHVIKDAPGLRVEVDEPTQSDL